MIPLANTMTGRTCVWIKKSVIKETIGVNGSNGSPSRRVSTTRSPIVEWPWVFAEVVDGDLSAMVSHSRLDNGVPTTTLKVRVLDEGSEFHKKLFEIDSAVLTKKRNGQPRVELANPEESSAVPEKEHQQTSLPPDDLTTLTHLHEPSVVYCLSHRYDQDIIYTSTGPILLMVNPYKELDGLYDEETMETYWAHGEGLLRDPQEEKKQLHPHIFANTDAAFRKMMSGVEFVKQKQGEDDLDVVIDQSILVSGESGAGKTVTTKHIMKYLATLSERRDKFYRQKQAKVEASKVVQNGSHLRPSNGLTRGQSWRMGALIEEKVLESNPILESFGNARTIRNDNSSRFGKFIQLYFKDTGSLVGAAIETYLLETVRLNHQGFGERNFHVFYELLASAGRQQRKQYHLENCTAHDFKLTNSSGTYHRRDGVQDDKLFRQLVVALKTMGFTRQMQSDIFGVVAAFLHASNLNMVAVTEDSSKIDSDNPHLVPFLALLGLQKGDLESAICEFQIQARSSSYTKQVSKANAEEGLEALITSTYGALFTFIVETINETIHCKESITGARRVGSIGVLDIFGFESFLENSFEQLCINYCNEALQRQFNWFIFETEQSECQKAGIAWEFIEFPDNKDVIELIDRKGSGIMSILTDQCRSNVGTDQMFSDQMYRMCGTHSRFEASGLVKARGQFIVYHYAGPVKNDSQGFIEKNINEIPRGISRLLKNSTNSFLQSLGEIVGTPPPSTPRGNTRPTVGSTFRAQLADLTRRIDQTFPHYVRCLKPNQDLQPNRFNNVVVADQLACTGVLEAVRVSRAGYPQRYEHSQFIARYGVLLSDQFEPKHENVHEMVNAVAWKIWKSQYPNSALPSKLVNAVGIHIGEGKVYLRHSAFELVERLRAEHMAGGAVLPRRRRKQPVLELLVVLIIVVVLCLTATRFRNRRRTFQTTNDLKGFEKPSEKRKGPWRKLRFPRRHQK